METCAHRGDFCVHDRAKSHKIDDIKFAVRKDQKTRSTLFGFFEFCVRRNRTLCLHDLRDFHRDAVDFHTFFGSDEDVLDAAQDAGLHLKQP